jgi:hypothetical protein
MISALSAASNGMQSALVRFSRAAQTVTNSAALDSSVAASDATDIVTGITDMMTARLAFSASLRVAETSQDMLAEAIGLGGYGMSAESSR